MCAKSILDFDLPRARKYIGKLRALERQIRYDEDLKYEDGIHDRIINSINVMEQNIELYLETVGGE